MKAGRVMQGLGIALGAGVLGAGIGILCAPHSGERTRRLIRRKAEDLGNDVREMYERVRENGNGAARRLVYKAKLRLTPRAAMEQLTGQKAG